ncbi:Dbl homology domain-containing protein, partial [Piptocephalis cylindrospora]
MSEAKEDPGNGVIPVQVEVDQDGKVNDDEEGASWKITSRPPLRISTSFSQFSGNSSQKDDDTPPNAEDEGQGPSFIPEETTPAPETGPKQGLSTDSELDSWDWQSRRRAALEILTSERSYMESLHILERFYQIPLCASVSLPTQLISPLNIRIVFGNLSDIIMQRIQLDQPPPSHPDRGRNLIWDPRTDEVGDIFLVMTSYLKVYGIYSRGFYHALERVTTISSSNSAFASFLKTQAAKHANPGLDLHHRLLEPIQRIPKYKLLLEKLLKYTPPSHPDYSGLQGGLTQVVEVANQVNEMIKKQQEHLKMLEIQRNIFGLGEKLVVPGRYLVKQGTIRKICRSSHQPRELFLFSDVLIYAAPPPLFDGMYVFRMKFPLGECRVTRIPDQASRGMRNAFFIGSRLKSFEAYVETETERDAWVTAISRAIQEYQSAQQTLRRDPKIGELKAMVCYVNEEYEAPVWQEDWEASRCLVCMEEFRVYRRRHHCRLCGYVVCGSCSTRRFLIPGGAGGEGDRMARACDQCM